MANYGAVERGVQYDVEELSRLPATRDSFEVGKAPINPQRLVECVVPRSVALAFALRRQRSHARIVSGAPLRYKITNASSRRFYASSAFRHGYPGQTADGSPACQGSVSAISSAKRMTSPRLIASRNERVIATGACARLAKPKLRRYCPDRQDQVMSRANGKPLICRSYGLARSRAVSRGRRIRESQYIWRTPNMLGVRASARRCYQSASAET
jgi:hypothetical protein